MMDHFNNGKGEKWKINKGSRQGRFLLPLLFNLYIEWCTYQRYR